MHYLYFLFTQVLKRSSYFIDKSIKVCKYLASHNHTKCEKMSCARNTQERYSRVYITRVYKTLVLYAKNIKAFNIYMSV